MQYDVFISYSKEDELTAVAICKELEASGIQCWIAPRDISEGDDWTSAIMDGVNQCRVMVMVFSGFANLSSHVHREVGHAFDRGLTVIPFRVEDTEASERLQYYLRSVQWMNAFPPPIEQYLSRLAKRVNKLLTKMRVEESSRASLSGRELTGKALAATSKTTAPTHDVAAKPLSYPAPTPSAATILRERAVAVPPGAHVSEAESGRVQAEGSRSTEPYGSSPRPSAGSDRRKVIFLAVATAVVASAGTAWVLSMVGQSSRQGTQEDHSTSHPATPIASVPSPSAQPATSLSTLSLAPVATTQSVPSSIEVVSIQPRATPPSATASLTDRNAVKRGTDFTNGTGQTMVWIEKLGLWVAAHETTQGQYQHVLKTNPSAFRGAARPVERVTWYDANRYCDTLTQMERTAGSLPSGFQYRLPRDQEWSVFAEGAEITQAVHSRSKSQGTSAVGSRGGNRYGLYDILGNVWEWCQDDYSLEMDSAAVRAQLPDLSPNGKVLRGGSWSTASSSVMLRVDTHGSDSPGEVSNTDGFRVALAPER